MEYKTIPPRIIYLQYFDEEGEPHSLNDVTWCQDRINENDLIYILRKKSLNTKNGKTKQHRETTKGMTVS